MGKIRTIVFSHSLPDQYVVSFHIYSMITVTITHLSLLFGTQLCVYFLVLLPIHISYEHCLFTGIIIVITGFMALNIYSHCTL